MKHLLYYIIMNASYMKESLLNWKEKPHNIDFSTFNLPASTNIIYD